MRIRIKEKESGNLLKRLIGICMNFLSFRPALGHYSKEYQAFSDRSVTNRIFSILGIMEPSECQSWSYAHTGLRVRKNLQDKNAKVKWALFIRLSSRFSRETWEVPMMQLSCRLSVKRKGKFKGGMFLYHRDRTMLAEACETFAEKYTSWQVKQIEYILFILKVGVNWTFESEFNENLSDHVR